MCEARGPRRSPDMKEPRERLSFMTRGGRIRTGDLLLPKQARYQATLRPVVLNTLQAPGDPVSTHELRRPRW